MSKSVHKKYTHAEFQEDLQFPGYFEFGGPWGALGIMLFSHAIMIYMWIVIELNQGYAWPQEEFIANFDDKMKEAAQRLSPTLDTVVLFLVAQFVMAAVLPGLVVHGRPLPWRHGATIAYLCNAYQAWWLSLAIIVAGHFMGYSLAWVASNFGALMVTAMIAGDVASLALYLGARMTG